MKIFLTLFLMGALMLALQVGGDRSVSAKRLKSTEILRGLPLKSAVLSSFDRAQNAHAFWAFLTGDKAQVSPKLKNTFDRLELGFLFSPSGMHITALLFLVFLLLKKCFSQKISARLRLICFAAFYFFPSFAIKRIVILRLLFFFKQRLKKTWSLEALFIATFCISFLLGHYFQSPLGFTMSFLFMGTFIALRDQSRFKILLGLFAVHLLIGFFHGNEVSPLALLLSFPLIGYFCAMMSLSGLYLATFRFIHINWMEKLITLFLWLIKMSAKLTIGTQINASLFLILALWIVLLKKDKRWLILCLFLHTNLAHSPAYFISGAFGR